MVVLVAGVIIGFAYSWQATLCVIASVPLLIFGGIGMIRLSARLASKNQEAIETSGKVRKVIHSVLHFYCYANV